MLVEKPAINGTAQMWYERLGKKKHTISGGDMAVKITSCVQCEIYTIEKKKNKKK